MKKTLAVAVLLLLSLNCHGEDSANFLLARSAYNDGLYKIAERQLIQFIKEHPRNERIAEAYLILGECRFNLGEFRQSIQAYSEAMADPETAEAALYRTASAYFLLDEPEKCETFFNKYIDLYPRGRFAGASAFRLGECLFKSGDFKRSSDFYLMVREKDPGSSYIPEALYRAGVASMKAGEFKAARDAFLLFLELYPGEDRAVNASYWTGHILLEEGQTDKASGFFRKVFESQPAGAFSRRAVFQAALIEFKTGEYAATLAHLERFLLEQDKGPYAGASLLIKGICLEKLGETGKAVEVYAEASVSEASEQIKSRALYRKGAALLSTGDHERAEDVFRQLRELFPGQPEAGLGAFQKSVADYRRKNYAGALEAAALSLSTEAGALLEPELIFLTAGSHFALSDYESAHTAYSKLTERGKFTEQSMFYSAESLRRSGARDAASEQFVEFISAFPESDLIYTTHFALADNLLDTGKPVEAAEHFLKASQNPDLKNAAMLRRGDALLESGMVVEARKSYEEAGGELERAAGVKIAELLYRSGRYSEAAEAARPLAEGSGRVSEQAKYILAAVLFRSGNPEEAKAALAEFIDRFPGSKHLPAAFYNLGAVYFQEGRHNSALAYLEKLATAFPDDYLAHESRFMAGISLIESGNPELGRKALEEYAAEGGGRWAEQAGLRLGALYFEEKMHEEAVRILSPLSGSSDKDIRIHAHFELGRNFEALKNHENAHEMYRKVLDEEKDRDKIFETLMRIARIFNFEKEYENALITYRNILERLPSHPARSEVEFLAARALQNLGRHEEALIAFRGIRPPITEEMEAEIFIRKADCYFAMQDYEESLLAYLKTAYLYPAQNRLVLTGLESAAKILVILERKDEAVKIYEKIIELDPDGIPGEIAAQKLMEIKK